MVQLGGFLCNYAWYGLVYFYSLAPNLVPSLSGVGVQASGFEFSILVACNSAPSTAANHCPQMPPSFLVVTALTGFLVKESSAWSAICLCKTRKP
jgi:hypothetical protein